MLGALSCLERQNCVSCACQPAHNASRLGLGGAVWPTSEGSRVAALPCGLEPIHALGRPLESAHRDLAPSGGGGDAAGRSGRRGPRGAAQEGHPGGNRLGGHHLAGARAGRGAVRDVRHQPGAAPGFARAERAPRQCPGGRPARVGVGARGPAPADARSAGRLAHRPAAVGRQRYPPAGLRRRSLSGDAGRDRRCADFDHPRQLHLRQRPQRPDVRRSAGRCREARRASPGADRRSRRRATAGRRSIACSRPPA